MMTGKLTLLGIVLLFSSGLASATTKTYQCPLSTSIEATKQTQPGLPGQPPTITNILNAYLIVNNQASNNLSVGGTSDTRSIPSLTGAWLTPYTNSTQPTVMALTCQYGKTAELGTQSGGPSFATWAPLTGTCTFPSTTYSEANPQDCSGDQSACQVTCTT